VLPGASKKKERTIPELTAPETGTLRALVTRRKIFDPVGLPFAAVGTFENSKIKLDT